MNPTATDARLSRALRSTWPRRRWLAAAGAALAPTIVPARSAGQRPVPADASYADVVPGRALVFPRDHGAHDAWRLEWWYVTGWLRRRGIDGHAPGAGVQLTFFRVATRHDRADPSRFAPRQLLFAHAALALPERGRLLHAQRAARAAPGLADAARHDTAVHIGPWSLQRQSGDGRSETYRARIDDPAFALDLAFRTTAAPLLQGRAGYSRKGPEPLQASYYYSRPQLQLLGSIRVGHAEHEVDGIAWLDHEWSSALLDPGAAGWDWTGLNLDDGTSWTAFRIRRRTGGTLWSYARIPKTDATGSSGSPCEPDTGDDCRPALPARFEALRHWTSPRTGTRWPVAMRVTCGGRSLVLEPLFDDQELDARAGTGVLYWEGAVRASENGRLIGRGYLELTGYAAPMRL